MLQLRPYQQQALDSLLLALKQHKEPLLVTASVGAGKSLLIAKLLLRLELSNMCALCLTLNSELIRNNTQTYRNQGGHASIFCAGLGERDHTNNIVFASPHSVVQALRNQNEISNCRFNLIVVDECHAIDVNSPKSMYMRIFRHYEHLAQLEQYSFRIVGLTGTPYRGKSVSIVGEHAFFKHEVCNITTPYLIENGFLVKPVFYPNQDSSYDFSNIRIKPNGKFDEKQLNDIVNANTRLTGKLMMSLAAMNVHGAFIFCVSKRHCEEAYNALPGGSAAIITGDTPHTERTKVLQAAREGRLRYLLSVNCLMTGVDVPNFDCVAWLRPTESLGLYVQGIGRGLRLSPGKEHCIILDYAGNLDRHGHIDDPIINDAMRSVAEENPDYCIPCYQCNTNNKVTARRCIGMPGGKRCDYYFEWKDCPKCQIQNDKVARFCRGCNHELIDPNAKLKPIALLAEEPVNEMSFSIHTDGYGSPSAISICYNRTHSESYLLTSTKALNIFYANFVRKHLDQPSKYYMSLGKMNTLNAIKELAKKPTALVLSTIDGHTRIKSKIF